MLAFDARALRGLISVVALELFLGMILAQIWAIGRRRRGIPLLPPEAPQRVSWSWRSVVLVLAAYFLIRTVVVEGYDTARIDLGVRFGPAPAAAREKAVAIHEDSPRFGVSESIMLVSLINLASVVTIPLLLRLTTTTPLRDLGLTSTSLGADIRLGVVAFFLVTPWVYGVNILATRFIEPNKHPVEKMLRLEGTPLTIALAVVSAVALAPLAEEILFRGIIQSWLRRILPQRDARGGHEDTRREDLEKPVEMGEIRSEHSETPSVSITGNEPPARTGDGPVLATSVLFAFLHAPEMPAPIPIFFLSVALGLLTQRTGRLTASITLHALFNGFSTMMLLASLLPS